MDAIGVLDRPQSAALVLDPLRRAILAALVEPGSASSVGAALDIPRQKVNYHLRALEAAGLVHEVGTQQRRGLTERLVQASAAAYVVSPAALGELAGRPEHADRWSAAYLVALGARLVREVGELMAGAKRAGLPVSTLAIDTEIRFASTAERAQFTRELAQTVRDLAARYHDENAPDGRWHRLVVAAHPKPGKPLVPEENP